MVTMDPPGARRAARAADAADHAEAAQGERGVHVAPRRSAARRVRRGGRVRVHQRRTRSPFAMLVSPTCSACPRRTTRVPERHFGRRDTAVGQHRRRRWPAPRSRSSTSVRRLHRGPAPRKPRDDVMTELAHGDLPRRIDARGDRRRAHRRVPVRGRPGDDRAAAGAAAEAASRSTPSCRTQLREDRELVMPNFIEETLRIESPVEGRLPAGPPVDRRVGGVDDPGRHDGDAHAGRGQPRPAPLRMRRTSSASTGRTPATTWRSGAASTRARAGRCPHRGPRQPRADARPARRHPARRKSEHGPPRLAASTTTTRRSCCEGSRPCTSKFTPPFLEGDT